MGLLFTVLQGLISLASNIGGAAMALKARSDDARRRFFWLFVILGITTFVIAISQAILARKGSEDSRKMQLGDADHPPFVLTISLPGITRFVTTNPSDFPEYGIHIKLHDETHKTTPLRNYEYPDLAAHMAIMDDSPWIPEDDASEHRINIEIVTRAGLFCEELTLQRSTNNQWAQTCKLWQGMRTFNCA